MRTNRTYLIPWLKKKKKQTEGNGEKIKWEILVRV